MANATSKPSRSTEQIEVIRHYDAATDSKQRISLRGTKGRHFHVKELSNGCYVLEPQLLVPVQAIPARTLKTLERSLAALKKGKASLPIDLSPFIEG